MHSYYTLFIVIGHVQNEDHVSRKCHKQNNAIANTAATADDDICDNPEHFWRPSVVFHLIFLLILFDIILSIRWDIVSSVHVLNSVEILSNAIGISCSFGKLLILIAKFNFQLLLCYLAMNHG